MGKNKNSKSKTDAEAAALSKQKPKPVHVVKRNGLQTLLSRAHRMPLLQFEAAWRKLAKGIKMNSSAATQSSK